MVINTSAHISPSTKTNKNSVRALETVNINLAGALPATIDGLTPADTESFLLNGQTDDTQNGIYWVFKNKLRRRPDADRSNEWTQGAVVSIDEGTEAGRIFQFPSDLSLVLGTTSINFTETNVSSGETVPAATCDVAGKIKKECYRVGDITRMANFATIQEAVDRVESDIAAGSTADHFEIRIEGGIYVEDVRISSIKAKKVTITGIADATPKLDGELVTSIYTLASEDTYLSSTDLTDLVVDTGLSDPTVAGAEVSVANLDIHKSSSNARPSFMFLGLDVNLTMNNSEVLNSGASFDGIAAKIALVGDLKLNNDEVGFLDMENINAFVIRNSRINAGLTLNYDETLPAGFVPTVVGGEDVDIHDSHIEGIVAILTALAYPTINIDETIIQRKDSSKGFNISGSSKVKLAAGALFSSDINVAGSASLEVKGTYVENTPASGVIDITNTLFVKVVGGKTMIAFDDGVNEFQVEMGSVI